MMCRAGMLLISAKKCSILVSGYRNENTDESGIYILRMKVGYSKKSFQGGLYKFCFRTLKCYLYFHE